MASIKSILIILLLIPIISSNAQRKNVKIETLKISGNCDMCKSAIEKAVNKRKEAQIEWNEDSNMASISYDSLKTAKSEILKRVALIGYDNEMFIAPDDTYASLPECCHYERTKKEVIHELMIEMDMTSNQIVETNEMEMPKRTINSHSETQMNLTENKSESTTTDEMGMSKTNLETIQTDYLKIVLDNYFEVKNALVKSDQNLTSNKATKLVEAIKNVNMKELEMNVHMVWMNIMKDLLADANKMVLGKNLDAQRTTFTSLSINMYSLAKVAKYETPVFYQFCPMANNEKGANWLSTESIINNPFFGTAMPLCGETIEIIK